MMLFDHYTEIPKGLWIWENFTPKEIACQGTGEILIVPHALHSLQQLRLMIGKPLYINSAYRSPLHNARIGGAPKSKHKEGHAFDISLRNQDKQELFKAALECGFTGFGLNYNSFLHIDKGRPRIW